jgi:hypothetical protein
LVSMQMHCILSREKSPCVCYLLLLSSCCNNHCHLALHLLVRDEKHVDEALDQSPPSGDHQTGGVRLTVQVLDGLYDKIPRLRVLGGPYDKNAPSPSTWQFARLPLHLRPPLRQPIRTTSFRLGHDYPFT